MHEQIQAVPEWLQYLAYGGGATLVLGIIASFTYKIAKDADQADADLKQEMLNKGLSQTKIMEIEKTARERAQRIAPTDF